MDNEPVNYFVNTLYESGSTVGIFLQQVPDYCFRAEPGNSHGNSQRDRKFCDRSKTNIFKLNGDVGSDSIEALSTTDGNPLDGNPLETTITDWVNADTAKKGGFVCQLENTVTNDKYIVSGLVQTSDTMVDGKNSIEDQNKVCNRLKDIQGEEWKAQVCDIRMSRGLTNGGQNAKPWFCTSPA